MKKSFVLLISILFLTVVRSQQVTMAIPFQFSQTIPASHARHSVEKIYDMGEGLEFRDSFLIQENIYNTDKNLELSQTFSGSITWKTEKYDYDSLGKLIRKTIETERPHSRDTSYESYEYDSVGNLIWQFFFDTKNPLLRKVFATYSENHQLLEVYSGMRDSSLKLIEQDSYDLNGVLIGKVFYNAWNKNATISFTYDSLNRIITTCGSANNVSFYKTTLRYNPQWKLISAFTANDTATAFPRHINDRKNRYYLFSYKYDKDGCLFEESRSYNNIYQWRRRHYYED